MRGVHDRNSGSMEDGLQSIVSHYDILGATADAEYAEIRSRYREAILALHPDKICCTNGQSLKGLNTSSDESLGVPSSEDDIISLSKLDATIKSLDRQVHEYGWSTVSNAVRFTPDNGDSLLSRFFMVQNAWEILRDPESRAKYDRFLRTERLAYEMKTTAIIGDEIHLREMNCCSIDVEHGQEDEYSYPCRCGDLIVVSHEELQMAGVDLGKESSQETQGRASARVETDRPRSNSLLLPCQSCSMHVRVLFF